MIKGASAGGLSAKIAAEQKLISHTALKKFSLIYVQPLYLPLCCTGNPNSSTDYTLSLFHRFTTIGSYIYHYISTRVVRQRQTSNIQSNTNTHDYRIATSSEAMISTFRRELNPTPWGIGFYHHHRDFRASGSRTHSPSAVL